VTKFPGTKSLYLSAAWSFAATAQTEQALRQLGVSRVSILPQSGIRPSDLPRIDPPSEHRDSGELLLVTAARLIHWKAIDLAIQALALASRTLRVRLIVLQTGPEVENLKALARRLGVEKLVEFKGRLPRLEDVYQEIARADALVHPALHEAFGQACLESLALGVPVICLNWGGPGLIVDTETGFAVEPGSRTETISRLAQAMVNLAAERQQGIARVEACKERAFGGFHWEILADAIVGKYEEVTSPLNHRHH
jgi:glycosyltransferase involved in cell wall biosynthesis